MYTVVELKVAPPGFVRATNLMPVLGKYANREYKNMEKSGVFLCEYTLLPEFNLKVIPYIASVNTGKRPEGNSDNGNMKRTQR